jgi:hypothetical protein
MFDFTSRYYYIDTATWTGPDGEPIIYIRRRFLPPLDSLPVLAVVKTTQGDRLDIIAARTLGAGELFWRLSDANTGMNPFDSTATVGSLVAIPMPQPPSK